MSGRIFFLLFLYRQVRSAWVSILSYSVRVKAPKGLCLLFLIIFLFPSSVFANVFINEIQIYPTEERFIELYNTGDSSVDLTGWYIQRKTATGSSFYSLISSPNFEGKIIGANEYFLISRAALNGADIILSTLTVTESNTIQIKNAEGVVLGKVGWGDSNDCNNPCPPNPLSGQSIYRTVAGSWSTGLSTPNALNYVSSDTLQTSDIPSEVTSDSSVASVIKTKQKIKTEILTKKLVFVGIPLEFQANTTGRFGEKLSYGKYFWNFGDGDSKETRINEDKFTHTYFYPGEYSVNLEYYMVYYSDNIEAIDKVIIKVINPDIVISNVGDEKDFFIELTNNTNYDADISKWILLSNRITFTLPKNTILRSKKKMIISSRITNFSIEDKNTLKLMTPQREIIYDYLVSITPTPPTKKESRSQTPPIPAVKPLETFENLPASTILSEDGENDNSYMPVFALVLFLGITSSAVYFIRRQKSSITPGDDFKLIDE